MSNSPSFDAVDDAYAEIAQILLFTEAYCQDLPWVALD